MIESSNLKIQVPNYLIIKNTFYSPNLNYKRFKLTQFYIDLKSIENSF